MRRKANRGGARETVHQLYESALDVLNQVLHDETLFGTNRHRRAAAAQILGEYRPDGGDARACQSVPKNLLPPFPLADLIETIHLGRTGEEQHVHLAAIKTSNQIGDAVFVRRGGINVRHHGMHLRSGRDKELLQGRIGFAIQGHADRLSLQWFASQGDDHALRGGRLGDAQSARGRFLLTPDPVWDRA